MARICQMTGRRPRSGHNVSHSQRKTKRVFAPNVQRRRLFNPATGQWMRVRISAAALRTLMKWQREGRRYDLRDLLRY